MQVDAFSLKSLMTRLNIEPPVTADPDALGKILFAGNIRLREGSVAVSEIELVVDDTNFTGDINVGGGDSGGIPAGAAAPLDRADAVGAPAAVARGVGGWW